MNVSATIEKVYATEVNVGTPVQKQQEQAGIMLFLMSRDTADRHLPFCPLDCQSLDASMEAHLPFFDSARLFDFAGWTLRLLPSQRRDVALPVFTLNKKWLILTLVLVAKSRCHQAASFIKRAKSERGVERGEIPSSQSWIRHRFIAVAITTCWR